MPRTNKTSKNTTVDKKQRGCGSKMMGGNGVASGYGVAVYGMEPTSADGHFIKMNQVGGYRSSKSRRRGSQSRNKKYGGSAMVDVAVPAILTLAQRQMTRSRKSKKNFSRRYRK
jgi:hypothetical protein